MQNEYDQILKTASEFEKTAAGKEYMRQYMRERARNFRKNLLKEFGGKCIQCGSKKDLHFDHINKKKKRKRVSDLHSVNDKDVKREKKNLQLLCRNCHKKKTHEAWDYGVKKTKCGTVWMYKKYKCRCKKCTQAFKEYKKNEYQKRKQRKQELAELAVEFSKDLDI